MKMLYVHGGNDYAALIFEQQNIGLAVAEIINDIAIGKDNIVDKYEEEGIEFSILEVGDVSKEFRSFLREKYLDFDQCKAQHFYFEDEKIGE